MKHLLSFNHVTRFCRFYLILLAVLGGAALSAQPVQRALIIGINTYKPSLEEPAAIADSRSWTNLDGCVNDATAMRDLAQTKFNFPAAHTTTLLDAQASRERIIAELEKLVRESKAGDIVFIYYAGHGSQMKNSLSKEADKKDETIVPADAWKKGVADIRDKELARYFNQLLDKGVLLTVILDSCHSGSIGRGNNNFLYDPPKSRFLEESNMDAKDAYEPERPEERGALIISAAQDFEFAKEYIDENRIAHGAFTSALLKAQQQLSPDASVNDLYNSLTAIMKYYGKTQEPVLAGADARRKGTLFSLPRGSVQNKFLVAVTRIEAKGVEMQGGFAFGLAEGVKLAHNTDTLQIIEMRGANKSLAKVLSGKKEKVEPGTLFEVVSWASSKAPALKVYIPQEVTENALSQYLTTYNTVKAARKINWVQDIAKSNPDKIIYAEKQQWYVNDKKAGKQKMAGDFTGSTLQSALGNASSAFVTFPPSEKLHHALLENFGTFNNIEIVNDPSASQYTLIGAANEDGKLAYALVKSQVMVQDSTESLPARTDFYTYTGTEESNRELGAALSDAAFKIAKIRDWLMLQSPGGANKFPFKLGFQGYTSSLPVTSEQVKVGDTLSIFFEEDTKDGGWRSNYAKRYIYVFSIDSKGTMSLLFPSSESGNTENRFPVTDNNNDAEKRTKLADIVIMPPMGADNYFMLSTEQAISNLSIFEQEGVLSRGPGNTGAANPLEQVLYTGSKTRSPGIITPVTWSVSKKVLRTLD